LIRLPARRTHQQVHILGLDDQLLQLFQLVTEIAAIALGDGEPP